MSPRLTITSILLALTVALSSAEAPMAAASERCYGDWSDAAPIVLRERLRSARDLQDSARVELGGDIVRIVLCQADEGFVYRLVLRRLDGRIGTLTVNAAPAVAR